MSEIALQKLRDRFGSAVLATSAHRGDEAAVIDRARIHQALQFLRDDPDLRFNMPIDVTAVDWLGRKTPRFSVVYHLYSTVKKHRIRVTCPVSADDATVPTCVDLYPGLDWFERETYDMYGIHFTDHPDLRRMFMYDEFVGHPLRKDYPKEKRQPLIRRDRETEQ